MRKMIAVALFASWPALAMAQSTPSTATPPTHAEVKDVYPKKKAFHAPRHKSSYDQGATKSASPPYPTESANGKPIPNDTLK